MSAPGAYLDFPTAWRHFVDVIPPEDRGDVVKGLAKAFSSPPRTDAERERLVKAASDREERRRLMGPSLSGKAGDHLGRIF